MKRPAFTTTLFLGCMIAASASLAGTDVVKCIDAAGHIVLTDQPCAGGSEFVATPDLAPAPTAAIEPMSAPVGPAIAAAAPAATNATSATSATRTMMVERYAATPQEAPRSAWAAKKIQPAAPMSADAATLRTARMNLQAMDQASAQMRQQRLAGLN